MKNALEIKRICEENKKEKVQEVDFVTSFENELLLEDSFVEDNVIV